MSDFDVHRRIYELLPNDPRLSITIVVEVLANLVTAHNLADADILKVVSARVEEWRKLCERLAEQDREGE